MHIIDSYSETNQNTQSSLSADNFFKIAQSFTGDGTKLDNIKLFLRKQGTPPGNFFVYIYAHTGTYGSTGQPTGAALAVSDAFTASALTTSFALTGITFSGVNKILLSSATNYFASIEYALGDLSNSVQAGDDNTSPTHGGNEAFDNGSGWTVNTTRDLCFYVYGSDAWTQPSSDSVSSSESSTRAVSPSKSDSVTSVDANAKHPTKSLSDTATSSESSSRKPSKSFSDTATATESKVASPVKGAADTVTTGGTATNTIVHVVSDSVTPTDLVGITTPSLRQYADAVTVTDAVAKTLTKSLSDTATSSESSSRTRIKANADTVTPTDASRQTVGKVLADIIVPIEASTRTVTHPRSDTVTTSDAISKTLRKGIADFITTNDKLSALNTFHDSVFVDERFRLYRSGVAIIVPTNDWLVHPAIGSQGHVPKVGTGSNAPQVSQPGVSAAPTIGLQ